MRSAACSAPSASARFSSSAQNSSPPRRATVSLVHWIRSYYSAEEGKLYCEYEAPSLELLSGHAREISLPLDYATVVQNLEPSMCW